MADGGGAGNQVARGVFNLHDRLGEISLVEGGETTATATCATDCELVSFGGFEFGRLLATFPDVRARVDAAIARRPHDHEA